MVFNVTMVNNTYNLQGLLQLQQPCITRMRTWLACPQVQVPPKAFTPSSLTLPSCLPPLPKVQLPS